MICYLVHLISGLEYEIKCAETECEKAMGFDLNHKVWHYVSVTLNLHFTF